MCWSLKERCLGQAHAQTKALGSPTVKKSVWFVSPGVSNCTSDGNLCLGEPFILGYSWLAAVAWSLSWKPQNLATLSECFSTIAPKTLARPKGISRHRVVEVNGELPFWSFGVSLLPTRAPDLGQWGRGHPGHRFRHTQEENKIRRDYWVPASNHTAEQEPKRG